jgi:hypothetical protein
LKGRFVMAPLPSSSTPRFRISYTIGPNQHTFQMRTGASPATLGTFVGSLFSALGSNIYAGVVDFVEFAASGSDIFNLITTGAEGLAFGGGVQPTAEVPWAYTFIGRTSGGRRVRLSVFGAKALGGNYRVSAGEAAWIDAAIAVLVGPPVLLVGIDSLVPVWKTYANVQVNDHWIKQIR